VADGSAVSFNMGQDARSAQVSELFDPVSVAWYNSNLAGERVLGQG